ncbi:MAG: helix-turn-helix transcriptional regulator [Bacteroidota bacterium]
MGNQFGSIIKKLRAAKSLLQRQVASQLEMDTPMLSKIERGERRAKKEQLVLFATILEADPEYLLTLWLADQITEIVQHEALALKAMQVAEDEVKYQLTKKMNS